MARSASIRWGVAAALSVVILAGCGGVQNGMVTPVTSTQGRAHQTPGSSGDLLYVAPCCDGGVAFYTFPEGSMVGTLNTPARGLCSDRKGNVYVTHGSIYEYAHGGTTPIKTLSPRNAGFGGGCSVDPVTGNLAAIFKSPSSWGVGIFANAKGKAKIYYVAPPMLEAYFCGYDASGNLFVDGRTYRGRFRFAELSKGGSALENIALNIQNPKPGQVQWDGSYITVVAGKGHKVYQVQVSGAKATVVGTTALNDSGTGIRGSWIYGSKIVLSFTPLHFPRKNNVGFWNYPAGGAPTKTFNGKNAKNEAVTVSPGS